MTVAGGKKEDQAGKNQKVIEKDLPGKPKTKSSGGWGVSGGDGTCTAILQRWGIVTLSEFNFRGPWKRQSGKSTFCVGMLRTWRTRPWRWGKGEKWGRGEGRKGVRRKSEKKKKKHSS